MKAIRIHQTGGTEVLQIDEVEKPSPSKDQVLVQVHYSSINHMDLWVRKGLPGMGGLPLVLGCDASGVVVDCGDAAQNFKKGDEVMIYPLLGDLLTPDFKILGEHVDGVHQQFVCLPESSFYKLPKNYDLKDAASSLAYLTAWRMLFTQAKLKKDEVVLVMGATSGVGSAAVQFGKALGAHVVATAGSKEKCDDVFSWGADEVYNHYDDDWSQQIKVKHPGGVDVVFEHVGEAVWKDCLRLLGWGGRLVTCGATTGPKVSLDLRHVFIKQQKILGSTLGTHKDMQDLLSFVETHHIKPKISHVFECDHIKEAHICVEESKHHGKVLLKWV